MPCLRFVGVEVETRIETELEAHALTMEAKLEVKSTGSKCKRRFWSGGRTSRRRSRRIHRSRSKCWSRGRKKKQASTQATWHGISRSRQAGKQVNKETLRPTKAQRNHHEDDDDDDRSDDGHGFYDEEANDDDMVVIMKMTSVMMMVVINSIMVVVMMMMMTDVCNPSQPNPFHLFVSLHFIPIHSIAIRPVHSRLCYSTLAQQQQQQET